MRLPAFQSPQFTLGLATGPPPPRGETVCLVNLPSSLPRAPVIRNARADGVQHPGCTMTVESPGFSPFLNQQSALYLSTGGARQVIMTFCPSKGFAISFDVLCNTQMGDTTYLDSQIILETSQRSLLAGIPNQLLGHSTITPSYPGTPHERADTSHFSSPSYAPVLIVRFAILLWPTTTMST